MLMEMILLMMMLIVWQRDSLRNNVNGVAVLTISVVTLVVVEMVNGVDGDDISVVARKAVVKMMLMEMTLSMRYNWHTTSCTFKTYNVVI